MKSRIVAVILLVLFLSFIGGNTAYAKSKHHHKGTVSSQKIGQSVKAHSGKHKGLAKHSGSSRATAFSRHSQKA
ncbi:MAG: hypothetical protein ABSG82_07915 [Sedimentisphaerales bacterium]|jgi:hypothetical protein